MGTGNKSFYLGHMLKVAIMQPPLSAAGIYHHLQYKNNMQKTAILKIVVFNEFP